MASYHFEMKKASQLKASAVAKYEYITRTGRYRAGRRKDDLIHIESQNMPRWAENDPAAFWQAADKYERANGNTYRQIIAALPTELTREQQIELVREFVREHLKNHALTFAIHENNAFLTTALSDNFDAEHVTQKNPHVHIIFSERKNDDIERTAEQYFKRYNPRDPASGGAKKERSWSALDSSEKLLNLRSSWAKMQNRALERAGHEARVDHRSLAAQGINREPEQRIPLRYLRKEVREAVRYAYKYSRSFVETEEKRREYIMSRADIRLQIIFLRRQLFSIEKSLNHIQAQAIFNTLEKIDRRAIAPALAAVEQAPAHVLRRLPVHPAAASRHLAASSRGAEIEKQPAAQELLAARKVNEQEKIYSKEEIISIIDAQIQRFQQLIVTYAENVKKLEKEKIRTDAQAQGIALSKATKGLYSKVRSLEKEKNTTKEFSELKKQLDKMLQKTDVQQKAQEIFNRIKADSDSARQLARGYTDSIRLLNESITKLSTMKEKLIQTDLHVSKRISAHEVLQKLQKAFEKADSRSHGRGRIQIRLTDDDEKRRNHSHEL